VRTTRSVELTEAGRTLLAGTAPAFQAIADTIESTRAIGKSTTGTLRLTMPISAYKMIVSPMLADFQAQYPDVRLDLSVSESLVDIVRDGYHAGFRLGDRVTPGMVALRMTGPLSPCYFAAPSYLRACGRPEHPRDLLRHKCIRYRYISANRIQDWQFVEDGQTKTIDAPTTLILDGMEAVRQAVRDGHGISWSLRPVIEDELQAGTLETVLDSYVAKVPPYYLFYPEQNRRLELLRLFIDFLRSRRDPSG
jgi:DNA-binding transcriptional LysR family regulator